MGIFDIFKTKKNKNLSNSVFTKKEYEEIKKEALIDADEWLKQNKVRLEKESMKRSNEFANIHTNALSKININALKNIKNIESIDLSPKEILFLNFNIL